MLPNHSLKTILQKDPQGALTSLRSRVVSDFRVPGSVLDQGPQHFRPRRPRAQALYALVPSPPGLSITQANLLLTPAPRVELPSSYNQKDSKGRSQGSCLAWPATVHSQHLPSVPTSAWHSTAPSPTTVSAQPRPGWERIRVQEVYRPVGRRRGLPSHSGAGVLAAAPGRPWPCAQTERPATPASPQEEGPPRPDSWGAPVQASGFGAVFAEGGGYSVLVGDASSTGF